MKKAGILIALLLALTLVPGCVTTKGEGTPAQPVTTLERIAQSGQLVVGTAGSMPPMNMTTKSGEVIGLEMDMANDAESVLESEIVKRIASSLGKTPAQVVLRWGIQRGTSVIPKSIRAERMRENLDIFNFELTDEEMAKISALNINRRFNDPGHFCEEAFNTFYPIYD